MASTPIDANLRRYFQKMFNLYDTDKSGAIGISELRNLIKHVGVEMDEASVVSSLRAIGINTTDIKEIELSFDLFVRWFSQAGGGDQHAILKAKISAAGARSLNNDQLERLREVFDHFDMDHSGSIDADELGTVFRAMGNELPEAEIKKLIQEVDDDDTGQIEFEEFILLMCANFGESFESSMQQAFSKADPDNTGLIAVQELFRLMRENAGDQMTDDETWEIIHSLELKDGKVEYMKWESLWEACKDA